MSCSASSVTRNCSHCADATPSKDETTNTGGDVCDGGVYDVIVIGGGLSGLYAAATLKRKAATLDVLVVEAKACLGGRLRSVPMTVAENGVRVFDVGGQWVSSAQPQLLDLIDELGLCLTSQRSDGLKVVETSPGQTHAYDAAHPTTRHILVNMELYAFIAKIDDLCMSIPIDGPSKLCIADELDSTSMETLIDGHLTTRAAKNIMKSIVRTTTGMEARRTSVLYYLAYSNSTIGVCNQYMCTDGGAREFYVSGGAQQICFRLAKRIGHENVVFDETVVRVDHGDDGVAVTTNKRRRYTSSCAIVAIPPTDIAKIEFAPDLPEAKNEALYEVLFGKLVKFVVTYRKAFWREKGYSGEALCNEGPVLLSYDASVGEHPALTGYARAPNAARVRVTQQPDYDTSTGGLRTKVLQHLSELWGDDALRPIDYYESTWDKSTACPLYGARIGSGASFHEIWRPYKRIYWAGAETATHWNGYMSGAVQAGCRAALEVLYVLRPQTLSWMDFSCVDDSFLSQYPNSLPKKTDEQSALNRILQETATNVIDVAALNSHNLEQHEYIDRMKQYVQRVQQACVGGTTHVPKRPCLLVDIASPEKILSSEPIERSDWESMNSYVARAASAVGELRVEHKEDLVVPFRIP